VVRECSLSAVEHRSSKVGKSDANCNAVSYLFSYDILLICKFTTKDQNDNFCTVFGKTDIYVQYFSKTAKYALLFVFI